MKNNTAPACPESSADIVPLYPDTTSTFYDLPKLCPIPNGPALSFLIDFLQAGGMMPECGRNHNVRYLKTENERHQLSVCRNSKNARSPALRICVDEKEFFDRLSGNNVWAEKLLLFLLAESNCQGNPDKLGFPLKVLVNAGLYSTVNNARRGLTAFMEFQRHISIEQADKNGTYHGGALFTACDIKSNYVTLTRSTAVDFLSDYFTFLPSFAFSLSDGAFVLLHYVFSLARQKTAQIAEKGGFTLFLRGICERMELPPPDNVPNRKYRERIRHPIESAVSEINAAAVGFVDGTLALEIVAPDGRIHEWLDGYLKIQMDGAYAESFNKIAASRTCKMTRFTDAKEKEAAKIAARAESKKKKAPDPVRSVS